LTFVAVGILTAVVLGEVAVRLAAAITHRIPVFVSDKQAGWANRRNLRNETRAGDGGEFTISTDDEGHRLTRALNEPPPTNRRALILAGDSFCLGQGVNDTETYAWLLAHDMSRNVVNLGVFGYGTDQELIGLAGYLEAHPDVEVGDVVVLVLDNDMTDVQVGYQAYLGRSKPRFKLIGEHLEQPAYEPSFSDRLMDVSYLYWVFNGKRAPYFGGPRVDPVQGIDMVVACLSSMRDLTARRGGRFHVLAHHYIGRPEPFAQSAWSGFLHRTGATDITPRLRAEDGVDLLCYDRGHWSPAGHRLVARIVREELERE
jgi:hypothetical protein